MGHLGWLFKLNPHPRHQHCTDEAQKAETVLSAVIIIIIIIIIIILTTIIIIKVLFPLVFSVSSMKKYTVKTIFLISNVYLAS